MSSPNLICDAHQISTWRDFNRFYTAKLGLLRSSYLESEFSLTEARVLYEILREPGVTAAILRKRLGLDAGYMSRLLASLTRQNLLISERSSSDGREKLLRLTAAGRRTAARLDKLAEDEIARHLAAFSLSDREALIGSLSRVRQIMAAPAPGWKIVRASIAQLKDALELLNEYFAEMQVIQRDTPSDVEEELGAADSGFWIAYAGSTPAGCVALRPLPNRSPSAECKRMFVRSKFRNLGIAHGLLAAMEEFARSEGCHWIYLDSAAEFHAALSLYRRHGYRPCQRYNDNPQATVFLRKGMILSGKTKRKS